jgi:alpha-galactosidase
MRKVVVLSVLLSVLVGINALDNGLGLTPAMGYNSWYDLECTYLLNEKTIRLTADAFIEYGLDKLGYKYVNLDDCWAAGRQPNGDLYPDPVSFPSGIKSLADYIHAKGLKFGIYTDRGQLTCAGAPGAGGHEKQDAHTFAAWGVDFVKEDSCNATDNHEAAFWEYSLMRDAMNATGRPMYFDVCGWNPWYAPVGADLANEWRVGPDDGDWEHILDNINIDSQLAQYAGPGGFNNPCLLIGSDAQGNHLITELQSRFQVTMWAILAAPFMLSQNIRSWSDYMYDTYTNEEVIAVDQDRLGKQGIRLVGGDLDPDGTRVLSVTNVWGRQLYDKSWAVAFVNVGHYGTSIACDYLCFGQMGFNTTYQRFRVRDLWARIDLGTWSGDTYIVRSVQALGGAVLLKFTPM